MALTNPQRKFLRGIAQQMRPVVMVGQHGLTESVLEELEIAVDHHELVKVKIAGADREARRAMIERMCEYTGAELVHSIGHTATLFRQHPEKSDFELD